MFWALEFIVSPSTEWHRHEIVEAGLCLSGCGQLCGDSSDLTLAPGVTFLVPSGALHRFIAAEGSELRLKLICLVPTEINNRLPLALIERIRAETMISGSSVNAARLVVMAELIRNGFPSAMDRAVDWAAVGLLLSLHFDSANQLAAAPRQEDARMRAVADWLDAHPESSQSLDELGAHFGMSRSLLTRAFRRFSGLSLVEYRNHRRLHRAAAMLAEPKASVTEIGFAVGFGNTSHFYHQFRKLFGVSPAVFRRAAHDDGDSALSRGAALKDQDGSSSHHRNFSHPTRSSPMAAAAALGL